MAMEDMQDQIQRIENKVQHLLKEYHSAQKEIQRLQKENLSLMAQLQSQTEKVNQMHQRVEVQKMMGSNMEEKAKKDLDKRINTYLKDIDKCLALLHS
jgi:peptidoglycan hydrolase CwlO-like protein